MTATTTRPYGILYDHDPSLTRDSLRETYRVPTLDELVAILNQASGTFGDLEFTVDAVGTLVGDVLTIGLRHGRHGFDAMQEAVEERANAWRSRLFRRVEYLNIIGNIAPLMGLLGTVMGMIQPNSFLDVVFEGFGWIGPFIVLLSIAATVIIIEHFWSMMMTVAAF